MTESDEGPGNEGRLPVGARAILRPLSRGLRGKSEELRFGLSLKRAAKLSARPVTDREFAEVLQLLKSPSTA